MPSSNTTHSSLRDTVPTRRDSGTGTGFTTAVIQSDMPDNAATTAAQVRTDKLHDDIRYFLIDLAMAEFKLDPIYRDLCDSGELAFRSHVYSTIVEMIVPADVVGFPAMNTPTRFHSAAALKRADRQWTFFVDRSQRRTTDMYSGLSFSCPDHKFELNIRTNNKSPPEPSKRIALVTFSRPMAFNPSLIAGKKVEVGMKIAYGVAITCIAKAIGKFLNQGGPGLTGSGPY